MPVIGAMSQNVTMSAEPFETDACRPFFIDRVNQVLVDAVAFLGHVAVIVDIDSRLDPTVKLDGIEQPFFSASGFTENIVAPGTSFFHLFSFLQIL